MKHFTTQIISNQKISEDFFKLRFKCKEMKSPLVGQFLTLKVDQTSHHILKRPFAFSSWNEEKKEAEIIYQQRGIVTTTLSQKKKGDTITLLAPIGKGFPNSINSPELQGCKQVILVAGGVGLGPMLFTDTVLTDQNIPTSLISGFRSKNFIPNKKELPQKMVICTDDGSAGFNGNVVDYLESLPKSEIEKSVIMSCGPLPMMKALHNWTRRAGLPCYVSMEEIMACSVGACMGCIVKTTDEKGYARACMEGPVFESHLIDWN